MKLFVRIQQRQQAASFYRCGMAFTKDWQAVDVDDATAARLQAEQMLDVAEEQPADFEESAADREAEAAAAEKAAADEAAAQAEAEAKAKAQAEAQAAAAAKKTGKK